MFFHPHFFSRSFVHCIHFFFNGKFSLHSNNTHIPCLVSIIWHFLRFSFFFLQTIPFLKLSNKTTMKILHFSSFAFIVHRFLWLSLLESLNESLVKIIMFKRQSWKYKKNLNKKINSKRRFSLSLWLFMDLIPQALEFL